MPDPDLKFDPSNRFETFTRLRNLPPPRPVLPPEPPTPEELSAQAPPRDRFDAFTRLRKTSESSRTTPAEQPMPTPNERPAMWEVVIDQWTNPAPGSMIDLLVRGLRGHGEPDPEIRDTITADMAARDLVGRERYGTPLQPGNGRDSMRDAYEEALDLRVYVETALYEGRFEEGAGEQIASRIDGILIDLRRRMR